MILNCIQLVLLLGRWHENNNMVIYKKTSMIIFTFMTLYVVLLTLYLVSLSLKKIDMIKDAESHESENKRVISSVRLSQWEVQINQHRLIKKQHSKLLAVELRTRLKIFFHH